MRLATSLAAMDSRPCVFLSALAPEVGDDCGDVLSGGPPAGVDHDEELHEVLVGRRAGGLHQEHVAASHALLQLHVDLAVGEPLDLDLAELHPQVARHLLRQRRVGAAGEDAQQVGVAVHTAATPRPPLGIMGG
jgi:hypothetical protein